MDFTDADSSVDESDPTPTTVSDTPPEPHEATIEDVENYTAAFLQANPRATTDRGGTDDPTVQLPTAKALNTDDAAFRSEFPWLYDPSRGVRWDFDPIELRVLAQENAWVEMLVQTITKELAETSWTISKVDDEAETQKRLNTHPDERKPVAKALPDAIAEDIHALLSQPDPDHDWHDLVEMWGADLLEVGSLTGVKAFDERYYSDDGETLNADPAAITPEAIVPSAPEVWTKDYRDKTGLLDGYVQFDRHSTPGASASGRRGTSQMIFFDKAEVVWSDHSPRTNRAYGTPPTLLVKDFVQSLDLAVTQEQQYLSRGSIPSGAWVFEEWDRNQVKQWKSENAENIKGKPHKSLMFAGQGGDVRFEPMSMNFKDLEFTERMRWYARVVASAFQVPTAVVGLEPEQVNYATFQGERENFEANTLGPYLQQFERAINNQIISPHWGDDYRFEFVPGMSESTRQMISQRVGTEFNNNLTTRNEARRELGREPVDDEQDGFKSEVVESTDAEDALGLMGQSLSKANDTEKQTFDDYPDAARENARMALEARDDTGNPNDCGTDVGWARANQLANGEALSRETVGRMAAFDRHRQNSEMDDDEGRADCGWLMWNAWGGDEGVDWAIRKLDELESEEQSSDFSKAEGDSDDEPLRNTDEWSMFDVQPGEIEALHDEIAPDVGELYETILSDDEIQAIIDELAAEPEGETNGSDLSEKSLTGLSRRLRDLLAGNDVADRIKEAVQDARAQEAREAIEHAAREADENVDPDPIMENVLSRDLGFADRLVDRVESQVREAVAEGWQEGKNSLEIRDDIAEVAGSAEDWGTERIARQELQIAAGEARNEFADEIGKVEIWVVSGGQPDDGPTEGDGRVRPAHQEMNGSWKFPRDDWVVDYSEEGSGTQHEKVPGDSGDGIGCRCFTVLADRKDVDSDNYAGNNSA